MIVDPDRVSVDRIRVHIRKLEGERHPHSSPGALERAAGYIHKTLESYGYPVDFHFFSERDLARISHRLVKHGKLIAHIGILLHCAFIHF
ncbi:hypothetical protein JW935_00265 [candidate division KSB1 bacterium]|nr:hypothetical protein [candidate division KSB1 bacterium]